jgi:hypothetical protein
MKRQHFEGEQTDPSVYFLFMSSFVRSLPHNYFQHTFKADMKKKAGPSGRAV